MSLVSVLASLSIAALLLALASILQKIWLISKAERSFLTWLSRKSRGYELSASLDRLFKGPPLAALLGSPEFELRDKLDPSDVEAAIRIWRKAVENAVSAQTLSGSEAQYLLQPLRQASESSRVAYLMKMWSGLRKPSQDKRRFVTEGAMGKINWARVLLGGLLAGVIINAGEFLVNGIVLGRDWEAAMNALGKTMAPAALAVFVISGFLLGISAIWLYAAVRPRFGPGARTAALTGFAFWIFAYALPTLGQSALGVFPERLLIIGALAGLVEVIPASVAGTWVYKE